jgi:hypothetical protein
LWRYRRRSSARPAISPYRFIRRAPKPRLIPQEIMAGVAAWRSDQHLGSDPSCALDQRCAVEAGKPDVSFAVRNLNVVAADNETRGAHRPSTPDLDKTEDEVVIAVANAVTQVPDKAEIRIVTLNG